MSTLLWIVTSTFLISLIAFIGVVSLAIKEKVLQKLLIILVSLSAGALMGGAFLHLIPEAVTEFADPNIFTYVLVGFVLFFLIEKVLHWRHCHKEHCPIHTFAYMNLIGDCVHNFIDGLIIAASFVTDIPLGITTTLAVALHEIPQEIGDFGVLVYGGFDKLKALFVNFICAVTAVAGGIIGYYLSSTVADTTVFLLPFAAGGFIYIAASDLIPEIRKETNTKKAALAFVMFLIGIGLMMAVKLL